MTRVFFQYVTPIFFLWQILEAHPWGTELGAGGGWRRDHLLQDIYAGQGVSDPPGRLLSHETMLLVPLWEGRGFFAILYDRLRCQGDIRFAPYHHGSGFLINNVSPRPAYIFQDFSPQGYALGTFATFSYEQPVCHWLNLLPLVGYTYDKMKAKRTHIHPNPAVVVLDSSPRLFFLTLGTERVQVWGPFVGADFKLNGLHLHLQAGYEYQFLTYKITDFDAINGALNLRYVQKPNAFAHQGHLTLSWDATSHFRLTLLGEATYRYLTKSKDSKTTYIRKSVTTSSSHQPVQAFWFTLSTDVILSFRF